MKNNTMKELGQHAFGPYLIRTYELPEGSMLLNQPVKFAVQAFRECDPDDDTVEVLLQYRGKFYESNFREIKEPCSPVYAMSGNDLDELVVDAEYAVAEMFTD